MGQVRRRQFLIASGALLAVPRFTIAQPAKRPPVVGLLGPVSPSGLWPDGFVAVLRKFGLEHGRDYVLDVRWSGGDDARLPKLAAELAASGAAMIVAVGNYATEAARRATQTLPIVMLFVALPVENGYIRTLAKPGGNVTGVTWDPPEIAGKKLELIRDAVPGLKRIALLWQPDFPGMRIYGAYADRAAAVYGVTLEHFDVTRAGDFSRALDGIAAYRPDALYVVPTGEIARRQDEVTAFARARRLVSFGTSATWIASGGMLYYGPDFSELLERGASYVDRLLRGVKVADLPVEQPHKYQLLINAKAAREVGHTIPQSLLLRADRVIE